LVFFVTNRNLSKTPIFIWTTPKWNNNHVLP
jgi:hypothetical protein